MFKLNKGIHFNILTIFAIVFVCVYLYYTISDLRKVAVEVKKHTNDINTIVTNLAAVNKDLNELKKKTSETINIPQPPLVHVAEAGATNTIQEDDVSSVDTNDVKNLLSDIPDDDVPTNDVPNEEPVSNNTPAQWGDMTIEQLKKECKSVGLSTKGTKDVLVGRLSEHHGA